MSYAECQSAARERIDTPHTRSWCRQPNRPWSDNERYLIEEMVLEGYSLPQIAKRIDDRSVNAIRLLLKKSGRSVREMRGGLFAARSMRGVARLFGTSSQKVLVWVRRGWLSTHRNHGQTKRRRNHHLWRITNESILQFMAIRDAWPTWTPGRINDSDWRETALDIRNAAGGCWITLRQAAQAVYYDDKTVWSWLRKGLWDVTTAKNGTRWYIWQPDDEPLPAPRHHRV